ncbi:hypothetical protein TNCT_455851 [Trichonephila clavata]|uniref:Uncharacterized protein n=1 Tax=Trichonephila clavata TaxID=2740835 RepID=A0A8X6KXV6_TRICU|nr:hypothetical protein TNCT_455851 [Trichonephila clavata]
MTPSPNQRRLRRTRLSQLKNKFADLPVTNSMDTTDPIEGTSTDVEQPAAPQKKFHVPPITIDNVNNQAHY